MMYYQTDDRGFFIGEFEADESPLESGIYLIPRGGVTFPPPTAGTGQIARFIHGAWSLEADLRGTKYWVSNSEEHEITELGISLPPGATLSRPPKTPAELAAEASVAANKTIAQLQADIFPDLLDFIAGLPGAPAKVKAARDIVNTEKLKVK